MTATLIKLGKLVPAPAHINSRKTQQDDQEYSNLVASIKAIGLGLPLLVRDTMNEGEHEVIDGNRRLMALRDIYSDEYDIPCNVREMSDEMAAQLSLITNTRREDLHPADQFEAMRDIMRAGGTYDDVAITFNCTPKHVRRLMVLGEVIPPFLDMFRKHDMNYTTLTRLARLDYDTQELFWQKISHDENVSLWDLLSSANKTYSTGERILQGLDIKEYMERGGTVSEDLFSNDDEEIWEDGALVDEMYAEKVQAIRDKWNDPAKTYNRHVDGYKDGGYFREDDNGDWCVINMDLSIEQSEWVSYSNTPDVPRETPKEKPEYSNALKDEMREQYHLATANALIRDSELAHDLDLLAQVKAVVGASHQREPDAVLVKHNWLRETQIKECQAALKPKTLKGQVAALKKMDVETRGIIRTMFLHQFIASGELSKLVKINVFSEFTANEEFFKRLSKDKLLKIAKEEGIEVEGVTTKAGLAAVLGRKIQKDWKPEFFDELDSAK